METFVLIFMFTALFVLLAYGVFSFIPPVTFFVRRLQGYKVVKVTTIPPFSYAGRVEFLVTRDGVSASHPVYLNIGEFTLHENGTANFKELDFVHAKWEYI